MNLQLPRLMVWCFFVLIMTFPMLAYTVADASALSSTVVSGTVLSSTASGVLSASDASVIASSSVEPVRCGGAYDVALDASINERDPDDVVGPSRVLRISDGGRAGLVAARRVAHLGDSLQRRTPRSIHPPVTAPISLIWKCVKGSHPSCSMCRS